MNAILNAIANFFATLIARLLETPARTTVVNSVVNPAKIRKVAPREILRRYSGIAKTLFLIACMGAGTSACAGFTMGVKEKVRVVYVSYGEEPDEAVGAIRVATNDPIPVTIVPESGAADAIQTNLNVGGYYMVSPADLAAFLDAVKQTTDPSP